MFAKRFIYQMFSTFILCLGLGIFALTTPVGAAAVSSPHLSADAAVNISAPRQTVSSNLSAKTVKDSSNNTIDSAFPNGIADGTEIGQVPSFTEMVGSQRWVLSQPVNLTLPAVTGGDSNLNYVLAPSTGSLPTWAQFDPLTRQLSGTPDALFFTQVWVLTATDQGGDSISLEFNAAVIHPTDLQLQATPGDAELRLDWTLPADTDLTTIASFQYRLSSDGGTSWVGPAVDGWTDIPASSVTTVEHTISSVPVGMTYRVELRTVLNDNTFTDAVVDMAVLVEDFMPQFGEVDLTSLVTDHTRCPPPTTVTPTTMGSPSTLTIRAECAYRLEFPTASGGNGTLTYTVTGDLVSGLDWVTDGSISDFPSGARAGLTGTPTLTSATVAEDFLVSIEVSDSDPTDPDTDTYSFSVRVEPDSQPGFTTTFDTQRLVLSVAIDIALPAASGGDGELTYALTDPSGSLPSWANFDPTTRRLSGTPDQLQPAQAWTLTVTDEDGDQDTLVFMLLVAEPVILASLDATPGDGQISLSWSVTSGADQIASFQYRLSTDFGGSWIGTSSDGWTDIAGSGSSTRTHTIDQLEIDVTYLVQLRAQLPQGFFSNVVTDSALTFTLPSPPEQFTVTRVDRQLTMRWLVPPAYEDITGYRFRFSIDGGVSWFGGREDGWRPLSRSIARRGIRRINNSRPEELLFQLQALNPRPSPTVSYTVPAFSPLPGTMPAPRVIAHTHNSVWLELEIPEQGQSNDRGQPLFPHTELRVLWPSATSELVIRADDVEDDWQPGDRVVYQLGPYGAFDLPAGLDPSTSYRFQTAMSNRYGAGPFSDLSSPITTEPEVNTVICLLCLDLPILEEDLFIPQDRIGFDVDISWNDPADSSISGWQFAHSYDWGRSWTEWEDIANSSADTTNFQTSLDIRGFHTFAIRAVGGNQDYRQLGHFYRPGLPPSAPRGLTVSTDLFPQVAWLDLPDNGNRLVAVESQYGRVDWEEPVSDRWVRSERLDRVFLEPPAGSPYRLFVRGVTANNDNIEHFGQFATYQFQPHDPPGPEHPYPPSGGSHHACETRISSLYCQGNNQFGQAGSSTSSGSSPSGLITEWTQIDWVTDEIVDADTGHHHSCVIEDVLAPHLSCWGNGRYGQLGNYLTNHQSQGVSVRFDQVELFYQTRNRLIFDYQPQQIATGANHTCLLTRLTYNPSASTWGELTPPIQPEQDTQEVWCWGLNSDGQIGLPLAHSNGQEIADHWRGAQQLYPHPVSGITEPTAVTVGDNHSCALLTDQTVWCWGDNHAGQIGDGTTTDRFTPTQVVLADQTPLMATALSGGGSHTCALVDANAGGQDVSTGVVCWGDNGFGQLGDGTTTDRPYPTPVTGLSGVAEIATGGNHSCARTSTGEISCWGENSFRQLGDTTTLNRLTPTRVAATIIGSEDVVGLSAGLTHTCIDRSEDLAGVCWGRLEPLGELPVLTGLRNTNGTVSWLRPADVNTVDGYQYRLLEVGQSTQPNDPPWVDLSGSTSLTTSLDISDLSPAVSSGMLELRATNATQTGKPAVVRYHDFSPPNPPTNLVVEGVADDTIWLSWDIAPATSPEQRAATTWSLRVSTGTAVSNPSVIALTADDLQTHQEKWWFELNSATSSNLTINPDTEYRIDLIAHQGPTSGSGTQQSSSPSSAVTVTTTDTFTTIDLTHSGHPRNVGVTWTLPSSATIDRFEYQTLSFAADNQLIRWIELPGTVADTNSHTFHSEPGLHLLSIRAIAAEMVVAQWSAAVISEPLPPSPPIGVTSIPESGAVRIDWEEIPDNGSPLTGIEARFCCDSGRWSEWQFSTGTTLYRITGLPTQSPVLIEVRGINEAGAGKPYQFQEHTAAFRIPSLRTNQHSCIIDGDPAEFSAGVMTSPERRAIYCWGNNELGQLGDLSLEDSVIPKVVRNHDGSVLYGASQISVGSLHSCALVLRQVYCWGHSDSGQVGRGKSGSSFAVRLNLTVQPIAVAAGGTFSCAQFANSEVWCWGGLRPGGGYEVGYTPSPQPNGLPRNAGPNRILFPFATTQLTQLELGHSHGCVLLADGQLWCWGTNEAGQLGVGNTNHSTTPQQVSPTQRFTQVVAGEQHTCALNEIGEIYCWGDNRWGQLAGFSSENSTTPVKIDGFGPAPLRTATLLGTGDNHICALTDSSQLFCWGANYGGQISSSPVSHLTAPTEVTFSVPGSTNTFVGPPTRIWGGGYHSCVEDSQGRINCWGAAHNSQAPDHTHSSNPLPESNAFVIGPNPIPGLTGVTQLTAGETHTCALTDQMGQVYCWGNGRSHRLGTSETLDRIFPTLIETDGIGGSFTGVTSISSTSTASHTCATTSRRPGATDLLQVYCWGRNLHSQLGDSRAENVRGTDQIPVAVPGLRDYVAVAVGSSHSCGINGLEQVLCWGNGQNQQIGTEEKLSYLPTLIPSIRGATQIEAGFSRTCVIARAPIEPAVGSPDLTGHVICWGLNQDGSVIPDAGLYVQPPQAVTLSDGSPITDAIDLAVGAFHTCAVRSNHQVFCWGNNIDGQLGNGTLDFPPNPTLVTHEPVGGLTALPLTGVQEVVAGIWHTCARIDDGTVSCWGDNSLRQLGLDPSGLEFAVYPETVPGLSTVTQLAAGGHHTCALLTAGTVSCWGENRYYQSGPHPQPNTPRPIRPPDACSPSISFPFGQVSPMVEIEPGVPFEYWLPPAIGPLGDGVCGEVRYEFSDLPEGVQSAENSISGILWGSPPDLFSIRAVRQPDEQQEDELFFSFSTDLKPHMELSTIPPVVTNDCPAVALPDLLLRDGCEYTIILPEINLADGINRVTLNRATRSGDFFPQGFTPIQGTGSFEGHVILTGTASPASAGSFLYSVTDGFIEDPSRASGLRQNEVHPDTIEYFYSVQVEPDRSPLWVPGAALADATWSKSLPISALHLPYAYGGDGELTYQLLTDGSTTLPTGLQLSPDWILTGAPSVSGTYDMTWTASDDDGDQISLEFSLTINNLAPQRAGTIESVVVDRRNPVTVDLTSLVSDPNGDQLTFTPDSPNTIPDCDDSDDLGDVAAYDFTFNHDTSQLVIYGCRFADSPVGIDVLVVDPEGGSISITIPVRVRSLAPVIVANAPTSDRFALNDASDGYLPKDLNLRDFFVDADSDEIQFSAQLDPNDGSDQVLTLSPIANAMVTVTADRAGQATVILRAQDSDDSSLAPVEHRIVYTVPALPPPPATNPVPPVTDPVPTNPAPPSSNPSAPSPSPDPNNNGAAGGSANGNNGDTGSGNGGGTPGNGANNPSTGGGGSNDPTNQGVNIGGSGGGQPPGVNLPSLTPTTVPNTVTPTGFSDSVGTTHEANIDRLAESGITRGCNPPANSLFCPDRAVTRGEMATFMVRSFELVASGSDLFGDDDGNTHEANINALASAEITRGCNPPENSRYCPDRPVTRAQMATFLARAMGLADGSGDFTDTGGSPHEDDINRIALVGITRGCNPPTNTRFCPDRAVTRGEMATFLIRAEDLGSP